MSSRRSHDGSAQEKVMDTPGAYPVPPRSESENAAISTPQSLSQAVKARKSEYIRKRTVKIKVGSWNVASMAGTELDIGAWFVEGKGMRNPNGTMCESTVGKQDSAAIEPVKGIESIIDQEARQVKKSTTIPRNDVPAIEAREDIGIYALGLQEIVDINSASEALRPFSDPEPARKWRTAVRDALPPGYKYVAEQQMSGLLLLIYASPDIAASIDSVSTTSVGTGLMSYMGNKGAVCARIVLGGVTRCVFINCHLAAGSDQTSIDRRNRDSSQIVSRTKFEPITDGNEIIDPNGGEIGDEDFAFWFGDLNYRLDDVPDEDVRRLLLLHTRNDYDVLNQSKRKINDELGFASAKQTPSIENDRASKHLKESKESSNDGEDDSSLHPESDPASLHTTLHSLLPHDQLHRQQKKRKAFHDGWKEGEIGFLPTYKYDVGSVSMFDSGEKKRGPSWCDRILYRSRKDREEAERQRLEEEEVRKRDAEMKEIGYEESDESLIFESDPGTPGFPGTPGYAPGDDYDEEADAAGADECGSDPAQRNVDDPLLLEQYCSHQRVLSSDHKPLEAVFSITYDTEIPELKAKVHQEVARELDKQENEGRPVVTVVVENQRAVSSRQADGSADQTETGGYNFGQVRYGVEKHSGLTLANTGGVPATFLFADRPNEKPGISPAWLTVQVEADSDTANSNRNALQEYTLSPGDAIHVRLSVKVFDFKVVRKLNEGTVQLDDVLVLRVKNGRDHFIPLSGEWMQSCYCRTLDELLLVPEGGVRQLQPHKAGLATEMKEGETADLSAKVTKLSAPRELFALAEAVQGLTQRAVAEWDMTHQEGVSRAPWNAEEFGSGWPFEPQSWTMKASPEREECLASAREALDTGSSLTSGITDEIPTLHRVEVLAETLVTFLRSLQDGIITNDLWVQMDSYMGTFTSKRTPSESDQQSRFLDILSSAPVHNVAFTFVIFMLARIASEIALAFTQPDSAAAQASHPKRSRSAASSSEARADTTTQTEASSTVSPTVPSPSTTTSPTSPKDISKPSFPLLSSFRRARSQSRNRSNRQSSTSPPPTTTGTSISEAELPEDTNTTTTTTTTNATPTTTQQSIKDHHGHRHRHHLVRNAYADIFAEVMIRKTPSMSLRERKAMTRDRMRAVVIVFMGE